MASDGDTLAQLTNLLKEFYSSSDNARKKEIETVLSHFGQQPDAWQHCLYFITNTHDDFVLMFCFNVLENVVSQQWSAVRVEDRLVIRRTVYQLLMFSHASMSTFIRNKLSKLIVYIARQDWPHTYPEFFTDIISLAHNPSTMVLSLVLLQMASEELACPRDDLTVARKEELLDLMLKQLPTVISLINDILGMVLEKPRISVTPTSSPAHRSHMTESHNTEQQHHSALRKSLEPPKSGALSLKESGCFDPDSILIAQLALSCLSHFFSWCPMQSSAAIVPAPLLEKVFQFAALGCRPSLPQTSLGETAMSCINELLGKNRVPADCEQFLLLLFSQTYSLLRCLTDSTAADGDATVHLDQLSHSYVDKFTEFLQLFVSIHLQRFESNPQFPVIDFLELIFKYTFKQPSNEGFFNCLHVWSEFLDYLQQKMESRLCSKESCLTKYKEALVALATQLLHKLQFRFNQSQLEELDDDILDDDCKTEWQLFLGECLEMMAKISLLYPGDIFPLLTAPFHHNLEIYVGLERFICPDSETVHKSLTAHCSGDASAHTDGGRRRLRIAAENDCRRLHCALRDLSSLLQALGRMSDHFIGDDKFAASFEDGQFLVDRLLSTAAYSTRVRLYDTSCSIEDVLKADFTEVHAQSLAAVKAYVAWLSQFYVQSRQDAVKSQLCDALIATLLEATIPLLTAQHSVPDKILLSCAHLLLSLLTTVRPAHLLNSAVLQRLYVDGIRVTHCPPEVELLVVRGMAHYLVLPWSGGLSDSQQEWAERAARLTQLFQHTFRDYALCAHQLVPSVTGSTVAAASLEQGKGTLQRALSIMTDIVDSLGVDGVSRSKQLCYTALCDYVDIAGQLLTVCIRHSDVADQLMAFILAVFKCLRVQMGVPVTEKLIQMLMGLFTREHLLHSLQQETAAGHQLIDKFLKILQVIVLEPSASFKPLLPSILDLCLYQIYPLLAERPLPDVKSTLYELLFQFLHYSWRYFFHRQLAADKQTSQVINNQQQFIAVIEAFGQSFMQPDIAIFRQNLQSLEALNRRHQLYSQTVMRSQPLLARLLTVLLQVLVQRSHALLHDEIMTAVYNMAAVDLTSFYNEFIVHFLQTIDNINDHQRVLLAAVFNQEQDLPTFTRNIQRFVNDLRYYELCSSQHSST